MDSNNDNNNGEPRLTMTVEEARRQLGISRGLIYQAINSGEIPHLRIGLKRIVIPRAAFYEWLQNVPRKG